MGNFTVGETVWTKRGTLTSFGVSVRSAEDWVQVELRKKGGTTGQQKGVWLVAYGEEEVEMKKQQLKRRRPGDRQPVAASQPAVGARPSRSAPSAGIAPALQADLDALGDEVVDSLKRPSFAALDLDLNERIAKRVDEAARSSSVGVSDDDAEYLRPYEVTLPGKPGLEIKDDVVWVIHPMGEHPAPLPSSIPAGQHPDVSYSPELWRLLSPPQKFYSHISVRGIPPPLAQEGLQRHGVAGTI